MDWLRNNFSSCYVMMNYFDKECSEIKAATSLDISNQSISSLRGLEMFTNVTTLNCANNQLSSLEYLPPNLTTLDCSRNRLTTTGSLLASSKLTNLNCSNNQIISLNSLPSNLAQLDCSYNNIACFPANLPSTLPLANINYIYNNPILGSPPAICAVVDLVKIDDTYLQNWLKSKYPSCMVLENGELKLDVNCPEMQNVTEFTINEHNGYRISLASLNGLQYFSNWANVTKIVCSGASLVTLPTLPTSLAYLDCSYNDLTNLPDLSLNTSLTKLDCYKNKLKTLGNLPPNLIELNCYLNEIKELPVLPASLEILWCSDNLLTTLTLPLPPNMQELRCYNNTITDLPNLPNSLINLDCRNNGMKSIANIPNSLLFFNCSNNSLKTLPISNANFYGSAQGDYGLGIIDISNNEFSDLPISYWQILDKIATGYDDGLIIRGSRSDIGLNRFDFKELENMSWKALIYNTFKVGATPQKDYKVTQNRVEVKEGDVFVLDATVGGTSNSYKWYKNGQPITNPNGNSPLFSQNATLADVGEYYCIATSNLVLDVQLKSEVISLGIIGTVKIDNISPNAAQIDDVITIQGSGFSTNPTTNSVKIGGTTALVESASLTELKVRVPVGVFGEVPLALAVGSANPIQQNITIIPKITEFSPTEGYLGDIVSIIGSGFSSVKADNEISFGTIVVPAADVRSASINALSVKVPNGAKGVLPIKVKVGTQTGVSATNFTVKGTEIQDFAPQEAYIGDKINLLGAGFSTAIIDNQVFFGTVQATVVSASNNLLVVQVPTGISGSLPISLKLFGDTYLASPNFKLKASEITEISPEEGFASETVSIIGNGFFSTVPTENIVLFGTTPATVSKASLTSLSVVIPSGINGSLPVSVTKGGEKVNAPKPFTIKVARFTEINPSQGYPNDVVTIVGEGFSTTIGNNKVSFGTVGAEITKASKNSLTVKVPKMKIGEVDVSVVTSGFAIPEKQKFTVRGTGITDVIPLIGFTDDNITILGDGFSTSKENNKVFFGTFAAEVISASRTTMTVKVPKDAKGEISVSLNLDKEKYDAPKLFKANVITVDAIIPASGKIGDIITITGFGFDKNAKVLIGGKEATITFSDPNKLNVKVPEGVFGEVEVVVEARGDRQKGTFLIRAIIDGFEPLSGFAEDKITFTGSGLNPDLSKNVILIGDKRVEIIRESFANNKFAVLIPKGVGGSVPITVNGEVLPNNLVVLTKVSNISPKEGIEGTEVTIFGTGFSPELNNNTISFNDVNVIPFEVKDDFLKVKVPSGISGEVGITLRVRASRTVSVIDNFGVIPGNGGMV